MIDPRYDYETQQNREDYWRIVQYTPMTSYERYMLWNWIRSGHDIYSNPWGYEYGDGFTMDYLDALRTNRETYELQRRMAEER